MIMIHRLQATIASHLQFSPEMPRASNFWRSISSGLDSGIWSFLSGFELFQPTRLCSKSGCFQPEFREMASQGPFQDTPAVIAKVKTLINAQLKSVLKKEGLLVSGVKAAMQDRIISRKFLQSNLAKDTIFVTCWTMVALMLADINQYVIRRDTGGYFRLRALIETADGSVPVSAKPPSFPHVTPSHPHQQQHPLSASGIAVSGDAFSAGALSHSGMDTWFNFSGILANLNKYTPPQSSKKVHFTRS